MTATKSNRSVRVRVGAILIYVLSLVLALVATAKFARVPDLASKLAVLGFEGSKLPLIAGLELSSAILFAIPRTRALGLLLVSAYLGGAIAAHVAHNQLPFQPALPCPNFDLASRIVILGGAATSGKIFFGDVSLTNNFGILNVVGQFCRANDVFTVELARQLASSRGASPVTITCLKIGVVKTNIRRTFPLWMRMLVPLVADPLLGQQPADVAACAVRLLVDPELEGLSGALFLQIRKFKRLELDAVLRDPRIGERLWELGERMTPSPQSLR